MNSALYADFLCLLVAIGLFVILFYGPWQHLVVDSTRQQLFEIRDKLFDRAAAGGRLDSQAHRLAREVINAQIRYAHELNLPHIVLTMLGFLTKYQKSLKTAGGFVDRIVADETNEAFKAEIKAALHTAFWISATAVLRRSLFLIVVLPPILALALVAASTPDAGSRALRLFGEPLRTLACFDAIQHTGGA